MRIGDGFAVWLTGLPASGKSTLAQGLVMALEARGIATQLLDSDRLRDVLTPQPEYTEAERNWFYAVVVFVAQLLTQNGVNVVLAATANRRRYRDHARKRIRRFVEVHTQCPLETCMARDRKGTYARALKGEANTVPGLQVPYEPPAVPELTVDTQNQGPEQGVQQIVAGLENLSYLKAG